MYGHARRWNEAPRSDRVRYIADLETALEGAINLLSIREQTKETRERLSVWRELLGERPPQTGK